MKSSVVYPMVFMVLLAGFFGAAVSTVAVATRARVEAGEKARFRAHVLSAFGIEAPKDPEGLTQLWERTVERKNSGQDEYYVARNPDGTPRGLAFLFQGQGFWGPIRGVVAVDPSGETIRGISFTSHQETPGLGGRITEEWFRSQFRGKSLDAPAGGGPLLEFVSRKPAAPREVEAITGATETSTRLGVFLNEFLLELTERPALRGGQSG